jgi:hypothetical protein
METEPRREVLPSLRLRLLRTVVVPFLVILAAFLVGYGLVR